MTGARVCLMTGPIGFPWSDVNNSYISHLKLIVFIDFEVILFDENQVTFEFCALFKISFYRPDT